jgi:hypothetical protein
MASMGALKPAAALSITLCLWFPASVSAEGEMTGIPTRILNAQAQILELRMRCQVLG